MGPSLVSEIKEREMYLSEIGDLVRRRHRSWRSTMEGEGRTMDFAAGRFRWGGFGGPRDGKENPHVLDKKGLLIENFRNIPNIFLERKLCRLVPKV